MSKLSAYDFMKAFKQLILLLYKEDSKHYSWCLMVQAVIWLVPSMWYCSQTSMEWAGSNWLRVIGMGGPSALHRRIHTRSLVADKAVLDLSPPRSRNHKGCLTHLPHLRSCVWKSSVLILALILQCHLQVWFFKSHLLGSTPAVIWKAWAAPVSSSSCRKFVPGLMVSQNVWQ